MKYSKDLYNDAVTMARIEFVTLKDDIKWWTRNGVIKRRALEAGINLMDHIMEVDDPEHAMSHIVKMSVQTKLIFQPDDAIYGVMMRMMIDIGKKMGPDEEIRVEFPLN